MESIDSLTEALNAYPGTVLIVSHSEELLSQVCNRLFIFDTNEEGQQELYVFEGDYKEFMEKGGWKMGQPQSMSSKKSKKETKAEVAPKSNLSAKEQRKLKAELNNRKRNILKPLTNKQAKIEKSIDQLEKDITQFNSDLIQASEQGDSSKIQECSSAIAQGDTKLIQLLEDLENVMSELEQAEQQFEDSL